MKRSCLYVLLFAVLGCGALNAVAQGSERESMVRGLEQRRMQAMMDVDVATLEAILDSTSTYTHSTGLLQGRQQLIDMLTSGEVDYRSIEADNVTIREYGSTAVVTGRQVIQLVVGGKPLTSRSRFTAVYVDAGSEAGGARMVAYQSTALPKLTLEEKQ